MPLAAQNTDEAYNDFTVTPATPLALDGRQGVSAPFVGTVGKSLLMAGGCNFPDVPAAEGGAKKFYDSIFLLTNPGAGSETTWQQVGRLPRAIAYGASVTVPDGVVCIGGTDGTQSLADVYLLKADGTHQVLPSLPKALDNMTAAYAVAGYIYVAAGQSDGMPSQTVYRLAYPAGKAWEAMPDMPGAPRLQATATVQAGNTANGLYILGGYAPATAEADGFVHTNAVYLNLKTLQWEETSPMVTADGRKLSLVGGASILSGSAHILSVGGVNADIFEAAINRDRHIAAAKAAGDTVAVARLQAEAADYLKHAPEWYQFNPDIIAYHTITDTWTTYPGSPLLARAGAGIAKVDNSWYVVCGETMPGIRGTEVTALQATSHVSFGVANWAVLIFYLLAMVAMGFYFMRRENGAEDFFKGGGRIPWWAAGISIYATMLSAITYMAYPAKAYATDWTYYPMLVTILLVSFPVVRYYLPFFRRLNVTSAYEYLERRFSATLRLMASALFIIFMVARMALVLYLPSLALTAVTGIDVYTCIVLMGLITIAYCTMGGVEAVVWGDVVQGIILVGGAIFAVGYLVVGTEGGVSGFWDIAMTNDKMRLFDWSFDYRSATFWVIILGGMANNLISYTSDQTVIQRYLTTKDELSARRSILMNGLMSVGVSVAFFAIGAGLYTFFKTHPAALDVNMAKADIIFPFFMMSQLPAGLAGLLIAAIFAATMSTISSNINSVATAFSVDFYQRALPRTSDAGLVRVARWSSLISGVIGMLIALLMATWEILSLLDFFQEILGLLSSGLGGLFLMGIFFPRIGGKAALIGFCSGVGAVFLTKYFTEASFLLYGFIGMAVSVLVALLFSYLLNEKRNLDGLTWKTLNKN